MTDYTEPGRYIPGISGGCAMNTSYPVIIGTGLRKGLFACKSKIAKGGWDLFVVWLNKDKQPGDLIYVEDIDKINVALHFCDKGSVKETIDVLQEIVDNWGDEKE